LDIIRTALPELIAEVERLKEMIYCMDCGGDVESPQIDEYGEGPYCDACLKEIREDTHHKVSSARIAEIEVEDE
jgi:hypothetical protein